MNEANGRKVEEKIRFIFSAHQLIDDLNVFFFNLKVTKEILDLEISNEFLNSVGVGFEFSLGVMSFLFDKARKNLNFMAEIEKNC